LQAYAPEGGLDWNDIVSGDGPFSDSNGPPDRRGMKNFDKRYCVYAIKSVVTDRIYIGQSNCWEKRFREHNCGRIKSTKFETPWDLFALEFFEHQARARWLERSLKKSKGLRSKWLKKMEI
jgi:putative endonuclease